MATHDPDALSPRQEQILFAVCRVYLVGGQPVSSGALARSHGLPWSSATLRAELSVLERSRLLHQPHTSAGRIPTARGLQRFVDATKPRGRPDPELVRAVDRSLAEVTTDTDQRLRAAAFVLSDAVDGVAVSFVGKPREGLIKDVDLVPLVGRRVLVVLAMQDGATRFHPVTLDYLPDGVAMVEAVTRLQERLRWLCRTRTLDEARTLLLRFMEEQKASVDRLLTEVVRIGLLLCAGAVLDPLWLQVAGQPNLTRALTGDRALGSMLALLEDYQRLAELLFQLLPDGLRAHVRVGALPARDTGKDGEVEGLALVGCRLPMSGPGDARAGAIAVLGPQRMDFAAVIPLVEYAARALASPACA